MNSLVLPGSHSTDRLQLSVAINAAAAANACLLLLSVAPVFHSPKTSRAYLLFDFDKTP